MPKNLKLTPLKKSILRAIELSVLSSFALSTNVMAEDMITLDSVEVVGEKGSDTKPVKGYNVKNSSASTKTNTALINVPQAITVIPQDVIRDQSILSIADSIRYVPGVTSSRKPSTNRSLVVLLPLKTIASRLPSP